MPTTIFPGSAWRQYLPAANHDWLRWLWATDQLTKHMKHILRGTMPIILAAAGIMVHPALSSSQSMAGWVPRVHDAQEGQNSLEVGLDAYREGALEVSVEAFSDALGGSLTKKQQAEALYFRGLAYLELGMPGQAILDLSGAISLKDGLSKAQLKDAVRRRDDASHQAGIPSTESVVAEDASVNGSRTTVPVPPGRVPVPAEQPRPWAPITTGSIPAGEPPPAPNGGFVGAVEKLIPAWP